MSNMASENARRTWIEPEEDRYTWDLFGQRGLERTCPASQEYPLFFERASATMVF
jgi:hypothetical protein